MEESIQAGIRTPEEIKELKAEAKNIAESVLEDKLKEDKVNHPSHYTWLKKLCGIEVIDITRHMCFNLGNVVKYVLRAGHKSEKGYSNEDKELEDLKKAKWYLEDEIKLRSGNSQSDLSRIQDLEKQIELLRSDLHKVSEANWHLRRVNILGEFQLSKAEILQAAKLIENYPNIENPITFKQSSGGIGVGTQMSFKVPGEETIVSDITDYDCW